MIITITIRNNSKPAAKAAERLTETPVRTGPDHGEKGQQVLLLVHCVHSFHRALDVLRSPQRFGLDHSADLLALEHGHDNNNNNNGHL